MTDEHMDARLRAAGERWRNENSTAAVIEPTAVADPIPVAANRPPTRRRWGLFASAAAVAAALVVGGTFLLRGTHSGPTPTGDTAALEGHVWLLTDSHGLDSTATLYIDRDGNLVADDDCTLIGGKATVEGDTMTVTDQVVRGKSCTDHSGPAYLDDGAAILDGASTFTITSDGLTITENGKELRFLLAPANTPIPTLEFPTLVGADWLLVSAKDGNGETVKVAGEPSLHIDDNGTLSGSDGCNSLNGTVTVHDDRITFGPVGGTEK
jgi:heat shock protein HslJ